MNAPVVIDDSDLARADAYALLANLLFAAPNSTLLATLQQMGQGASAEDEVTAAWNVLCNSASDEMTAANEHEALFVSVGKPKVPLYASWYLTGFLMEKPLALLRDDLKLLGLERQTDQHDPEDHMAAELEVMRHLIMQGDNDAQQRFFQRHLQPWYGQFCTTLAEADEARFYRMLANFMRVFLDMERDYFRLQTADGGVK